ncbi:hypothetical protein BDI4_290024 [Burkholderia diffusa]|nr:hypothetical protein BDI4_290024 [Burkholderia diffusa]
MLDVPVKPSQCDGHRSHEIVLVVINQSLTIVQFRQRAQEHRQLISFIHILTTHDIRSELGEPNRGHNDAHESAHYRPIRDDSHHLSNFSLHIQSTLKMRSMILCRDLSAVLTEFPSSTSL